MNSTRTSRVSEEVKHAISEILNDLKDPGITSMVSVVRAEVTRDFRYAKTYVSIYADTQEQREQTLAALKRAAGYVRRELGQKVRLHYTPEVQFVLDSTIEYGAHMSKLIDQIIKKDEEEPADD